MFYAFKVLPRIILFLLCYSTYSLADDKCVICGDIISYIPKTLDCGHSFHFHCIDSWLKSNPSCPKCERSIHLPGYINKDIQRNIHWHEQQMALWSDHKLKIQRNPELYKNPSAAMNSIVHFINYHKERMKWSIDKLPKQ